MKVTPALKKELAQWLDAYWTTYLKGDIETWATFIRDDYRNIGGTKEEIWNSKQEIIDYTTKILDQMIGSAEIRNREIEVIPYGEYMMVNEFTDLYVKIDGEWIFYGPFRMSSLLEKTDSGWIALHQHGSFPDMKALEGEAFSIDAVKAENTKLLEAVKSRTIELEIEAALERVRAVAMGMKKPEDMLDVCQVISDQLQQFGVDHIRNVQTAIIDENISQYLCYQYFPAYGQTTIEDTEYKKSPVEQEMVRQMLVSRDGHFIGSLLGDELEAFRSHRKEENHFHDPLLDEASEISYCFLSIGEGGLGLSLYKEMDEHVLTLFKRFHQVFSLAYQRFRDIQKAEAQAREAQIEVAVEKVRAQSMAMHHPDDLDKVNKEILTQLNWLQIQGLSGVTFYLVDQDGWVKAYDFSSPGNIGDQKSYTLQFDFKKYEMMGYPFKIFQQTDLNYLVADYPLEKLEKAVFEMEEINPEIAIVVKEALAKGILTHQWSACARITDGLLGIDLVSPPSEDTKTIVLKIAGAFNQAYQRFLDLQKAEAHARESEIDLALERVRAQTMAMHSSEDVGKCIVKMFSELTALGVDEGTRFGIGILNHENQNNQLWTARKNEDEVNMHIGNIDMASHPLLKSARKAWKEQIPIHKYVLEGKDLLDYYQMLNNAPDYKIQIPIEKLPKKEIQHCFIFEHGFFYAFSPREFQPELIQITKRFSSLFEQTYRRYLDLFRAEAQTREAEIELALERVRARTMAMHHTEELKDVIQVVFNQFVGLNIRVDHAGFILDYKEREDMHIWLADHQQGVPTEITFPYFDSPHWNSYREAKAKQESFFANLLPFEVKNKFYQGLFELIPELTEEAQQAIFSKPALAISTVLLDNVGLYIEHYSEAPFTAEENAVLMRFGKVFQQTYTRFLDLQKAEAQTREAQIEVALEKVRSRSMAMHTSDELLEVIKVVSEQFQHLGFKFNNVSFAINNDAHDYSFWSLAKGSSEPIQIQVPYINNPMYELVRKIQRIGIKFYSDILTQEDNKQWFQHLFNHNPNLFSEESKEYVLNRGYARSIAITPHIWLILGNYYSTPYTDAENEIIKRFGAVFEQSYTRFLDLQKAEEQAKEAQIEAALERVRSRSLAMHHSSELSAVVDTLLREFTSLEFTLTFCIINLIDEQDMSNTVWAANPETGKDPESYYMKFEDYPFHHAMWDAWKAQKKRFVYTIEGKEKKIYDEYLYSETEFRRFPKHVQEANKALDRYVAGFTFFKYSGLQTVSLNPISEDELEILERFGKVFEQSYTRFLDLQKAEAQAREAQIQLSLERIRAKAMAMQHSDELSGFLTVLFEQFSVLNLSPVYCNLTFFDIDNNRSTFRMTGKKGSTLIATQEIDLDASPVWKQQIEEWKAGNPNDVDVLYIPFESIPEVAEIFKEILEKLPEDERPLQGDFPNGQYVVEGYCKYGYLGYSAIGPPSDEEKEITRRISAEFGNVYQRFLDLQKAEAQAREAQIEAALEKVRSRSMAMHTSQELKEVALELRKQMGLLGQKNLEVCAIHLYGYGEDSFESWSAMKAPGSEAEIVQSQAHFPKRGIRIIDEMLHHYTIGTKDYVLVNEGEKMAEWFKVLKKHAPELHASILDSIGKGPLRQLKGNWAVADFSGGALVMVTYGAPDEVSRNLLRRSANVFEQAYVRFLDLQKAEAQAREAQIEVGLERVRSRTMAMHHSSELADTAKILFQQIKELGYEMWSCGFGIWKPEVDMEEAWMSTGDLFPIILLPFKEDPSHLGIYEASQRGESVYEVEVKGEILTKHYNWLMSQPSFKIVFSQIENSGSVLPTVQWKYAAFFKQGYLHLITTKPQYEIHDISRRFAKVFEQSYTRFLDLQKAEAQAREAQIEASLERVRSKTMAMHNSQDVGDTVATMFDEFVKLGIETNRCGILIFGKTMFAEVWTARSNPDGKATLIIGQLDLSAHPLLTGIHQSWKKKDQFFTYPLLGDDLIAYYQAINDTKYYPTLFNMEALPSREFHSDFYFAEGCIFAFTAEPIPSEGAIIFKRFAGVFGQTYRRFLDLQKAESQARESQIQLAMERVRARTMAMQHSSELGETSALLFQQIQSLGVPPWSCGFNIWEQGDSVFTSYMGSPDGAILDGLKIPLTEEATFIHFQESRDRGDKLFVDVLEGETLEAHYRYFLSLPEIKKAFEKRAQSGEHHPIYQINHIANFSHGNLMFITYEPCPQAHDIFIRFAKVFEQTYTRFLDLQKAEAQARESQIQLALERVRARTMAMHKSKELAEVAVVLYQELKTLGATQEFFECGYVEVDETNNIQRAWSTRPDGSFLKEPYYLPLTGEPVIDARYEAWKQRIPVFHQPVGGDELKRAIEFTLPYMNNQEAAEISTSSSVPDPVHFYCGNFSHGYLNINCGEPLSVEEESLLARFTGVFEMTYQRFLDLQKAEAQARESQIQLALERVRARTMAMQSSDELAEVSYLLNKQVVDLGIPTRGCAFNIYNEEDSTEWFSNLEGTIPTYKTPRENIFLTYYEAGLKGETLWIEEFGEDRIKEHYQYLATLSVSGNVEETIESNLVKVPAYQIDHVAYFKYGYLLFITLVPAPEAHEVFKRFAKEFEQTYTRFLDLQKAEAQMLEAKIEASLERVRSRTMGMQSSNELPEVANLLFTEVRALGIHAWSCGYNILARDKRSATCCMSSEGTLQSPFQLRLWGENSFKEMGEFVLSDHTMLVQELGDKALVEHYAYMKSFPDLKPTFDEIDKLGLSLPTYQINHLCKFTQGFILFITYEKVPESHAIFKRFTNVFDQTYTRFLDLKKAEAQARESQIEAALERVRSRSMAMHRSSELNDVANVLFQQLRSLGGNLWGTGIGLCQAGSDTDEFWFANEKGVLPPVVIPHTSDPVHLQMYEGWINQLDLFTTSQEGEELKGHYDYMLTLPTVRPFFQRILDAEISFPTWQKWHAAYFKFGYILTITVEEYPEEQVFKRFALVFEQAYTRFLDIKKAEAQAREAQVEVALERIRARALAMQSSTELSEVAKVLRDQMGILGQED
ncbi:MAG: nuclear transport factor 2 family protein, partial [Algoriphagus sp.]|nr:nuclear transport factor 2 family protein [Algoriphagus sp.]